MTYDIDRLLRRPEVQHLTGLSKSTLYEMIAAGRFPKPLCVAARAVRWRASDIAAWQKGLPVARGWKGVKARFKHA